MESFLDFVLMREPSLRWVVLGVLLYSVTASVIGVFAFLRKKALVGDAVSHSVLPGICVAFLLFQTKQIGVLLAGAFVTGWFSMILIDLIVKHSKLKSDTAIGLVLSVFFGAGLMLLTAIQKTGAGNQAGLDTFIFGNAASIIRSDVYLFIIITFIILSLVTLFFKEFKLISFDMAYAQAVGLPVRTLETLLATLTVLAVVQGIQTVGAVLMAAMLITPATAARYWTNDFKKMIFIAALVGMLGSVIGAFFSFQLGIPTGPVIIMIVSFIALGSMLMAPKRGIYARFSQQKQNKRKITDENILKIFFHLGERHNNMTVPRYYSELKQTRQIPTVELKAGLKRLVKQKFLLHSGDTWWLTDSGYQSAFRIVKIHRLWELYLTKYLGIADDHVHDDAEAIEHVITPELEKRLEEELGYPEFDPHGKPIEYFSSENPAS